MTDVSTAPPDVIVSPQAALPMLQKWFGDEMVRIYGDLPAANTPWVLMSCAVWGPYVEPFMNFTVPTMLTPANLEALAPCWCLIYTDPLGWPKIWEAMHRLEPHGIKFIPRLIPEYVLAELRKHDSNKYWALSVAQNLGMRAAGRFNAGYHMWMPDHLYGPEYFRGLKRLAPAHDIVAQTGISSDRDKVLPLLERYRHPNGWIAAPDRDLGTLAWENLHPQTRAYIMNVGEPPDRMPNAHFLCWQGKDAIHTYCCHQNASWLSPRVCVQAPNFVPATIDTRLPYFAEDFYVPVPADGMTFIEYSGANKFAPSGLVGADAFAARCWAQVGFSKRYMSYFMWPSLTPIRDQAAFMTDEAIRQQHRIVAEQLLAAQPPMWMETLQSMMVPT